MAYTRQESKGKTYTFSIIESSRESSHVSGSKISCQPTWYVFYVSLFEIANSLF